jgi:hypothetical protein
MTNYKLKHNLYPLLLVLFIGTAIYYSKILWPKEILEWQFYGPVQKITHDGKNIPWVTIKDKEYDLQHEIWDRSIEIYKGDTLIKKKGSYKLILIRAHTKDTIVFKEHSPS